MFDLVKETSINWTVVYLFLYFFSGFLLVAIYWPQIQRFLKRYEIPRGFHWDCPIKDAANYIAYSSRYGSTLDRQRRLDLAANAIKESAISKNILTAGRKDGAAALTVIKPREWKTLLLEVKATTDRAEPQIQWINLIQPGSGKIVYEGIMANWQSVESQWRRRMERI